MSETRKIESFSAGCPACKETIELVRTIAGPNHEVQVRDMHQQDVAVHARQLGVRSVPAVMVDGKLAGCCGGRGPDDHVLREVLR